MRDLLAERLLGKVLNWTSQELAEEQPIIDALARLKYDDYQQFKPGLKFLESLALWLYQFEPDERKIAYNFIKNRLIYLSSAEMNHLVDITYPTVIRPILLKCAAERAKIPYWKTKQIAMSQEYRELKRRSLFLGLSDGARIDRFRRANNNELSNEQIHPSYELSDQKVKGLIESLRKDIGDLRGIPPESLKDEEATFQIIFLLDDFSASGISMLRKKNGKYKGKLDKIRSSLFEIGAPLANAIDADGCNVHSILYIMTDKARGHLQEHVPKFWNRLRSYCDVQSVLQLGDEIKVGRNEDEEMKTLIDKYYDNSTFDENMKVGGTTDGKLGFAGCGLPVVLSHNTPNDSIFLLWSYSDKPRGLFPRVTRHKEV